MPKQTVLEAEAQAHEIENAGKEASARVEKGLFTRAAKLAELQQRAYKEGVESKTSAIKANEGWDELMNPTFPEDTWEAGEHPGYR